MPVLNQYIPDDNPVWIREVDSFVGTIDKMKESGIGHFQVHKGGLLLFSWHCRLPAKDAKPKVIKTFETDMANLMDGVIELKGNV